jgi:hypothetical protein
LARITQVASEKSFKEKNQNVVIKRYLPYISKNVVQSLYFNIVIAIVIVKHENIITDLSMAH